MYCEQEGNIRTTHRQPAHPLTLPSGLLTHTNFCWHLMTLRAENEDFHVWCPTILASIDRICPPRERTDNGQGTNNELSRSAKLKYVRTLKSIWVLDGFLIILEHQGHPSVNGRAIAILPMYADPSL